jgi:hypothetical protein
MITTKQIPGIAAAITMAITIMSVAALAQAPSQQPPSQQPPQQQPPQPAVNWERMPRMTLEAEFAGPLRDTTIQRWHDVTTDVVCYLYVPFTAQHSPPTPTGYVQYGPNTIGTISCVPGRLAGVASAPPRAAAPSVAAAPTAAKPAKGPLAAAKGAPQNASAPEEPR